MIYDTIIIGSGAAGLSAAIYASRSEMNFIVIEKIFMGTGQIAESERVDNYPGLYGENGYDLGEKFRSHAETLGARFIEGEVTKIAPINGIYTVYLQDGSEFETKTVIFAAGASHRKLGVKGEEELSGRGVSYCAVCDGAFYKNKVAAVVGGGDTALGDALYLSKIASKVYLIHRRDEFRANKSLCRKVAETENIETVMNAIPIEIVGDNRVEGIRINHNGREETLDVNGVFVAVGTVPGSEPLSGVVQTDGGGYIIAGEDCITSEKGIFAAGDVRTKPLRQVVTAAADGANSIYSAEKYISQLSVRE